MSSQQRSQKYQVFLTDLSDQILIQPAPMVPPAGFLCAGNIVLLCEVHGEREKIMAISGHVKRRWVYISSTQSVDLYSALWGCKLIL